MLFLLIFVGTSSVWLRRTLNYFFLLRHHTFFEFVQNRVKLAGSFLDVAHRGLQLVRRVEAAQVV